MATAQDSEISWVDWDLSEWQSSLLDFSRRLAHLRRDHRVFRQRHFFRGVPVFEGGPKDLGWIDEDGHEYDDSEWHDPGRRLMGMYLSGYRRERDAEGNPVDDDSFLLYLNAGGSADEVVLPGQPWGSRYELVLSTVDDAGGSWEQGERMSLAPHSAAVLRVVAGERT